MRNAGLDEHKLESRLQGEISVTSDMQMTPPLWQKQRGTKEPLNESERGEWKAGLKLSIKKTKIMASGPNHFMANRWGSNGNSERLFLRAPKSLQMVTAAMKLKDAYSLEGKLWPT